ncbi:NAD(P)/FAD-dependent oxidoreductase [Nocardioides sp.]|uniref:NAD(P)/FAD-dependent oxidoreductase n=1 Tax=Nocardioides sp. TaxID=35761 RepID=UPI003513B894
MGEERQRLLLIGAGHAHLHLLLHAERLTRAGYTITLVAPRWFDYSGGAVAAALDPAAHASNRIDVAALAARAGIEHVVGTVAALDPELRTAVSDDGTAVAWDIASLNIGSTAAPSAPLSTPPAAPPSAGAIAVAIKPLDGLLRLREHLAAPPPPGGWTVEVVGAGASGIELAAQLAARREVGVVHLVEQAPQIAGDLPPGARRWVERTLRRRGVVVHTGAGEERADLPPGGIISATPAHQGCHVDVRVVAAGLVPVELARRAPLGGPRGIPVRATLQHRDHDHVYAAGDCADFLPRPLPKVGVHGVRQGPVLLEALLARATEPTAGAPVYRPQERALAVIDLGDTGLAVRGRWWWAGRSALLLKRSIDRRWLARYS